MRLNHLDILVCPENKQALVLIENAHMVDGKVKEGTLVEPKTRKQYPIINFIPRFVSSENYAKGFGYQWNIHSRTQYDATSGFSISKERFEKETRWGNDLKGEILLEAGCGSGRFTPHALDTGATVVSFDYSNAVEANYMSNGDRENLLVVQADIYQMPFRQEYFNRSYCFGVLQHTPDVRAAFLEIVSHVKPGGCIASDVYLKSMGNMLLATKYKVRPFTAGKDPQKLYARVRQYIDFMWPLARLLRKIPRYGKSINWLLLIADYSQLLKGADDRTLREWAYLDTFDMLAPQYDSPQTVRIFKRWHEVAGLMDIDVHKGYNGVEGRARRPK